MAREKRLIDAYKLEELVRSNRASYNHKDDVIAAIAGQPTVDAVEVVRCKDCRWRNNKGCPYMNFNAAARDDYDYCSDGERRTDNG